MSLRSLPLVLLAATSSAAAQQTVTFSITDGGATYLAPDCSGNPIYGASLLRAATVDGLPALVAPMPPCIVMPHSGALSLHVGPGSPHVELDALSYGSDGRLSPANNAPGSVWFSVDERAVGLVYPAPSVFTEANAGDECASVFIDTGLPVLPAPFAAKRNVEAIDGNGTPSLSGYTSPGVGLVEPNFPVLGVIGDDLDALDLGAVGARAYFSLDGALVDPCGGPAWGSAQANGFSPAAIVVTNYAAAPVVWATPAQLGLDIGGAGTDDLDALALWENGNGQYDAPDQAFAWTNGSADMVLFSVRRNSFVIGRPDSLRNVPIEEGDVLMPPVPGGFSPFPAILIPAEQLGLTTQRSATAGNCSGFVHGDELDALDTLVQVPFDCNANGRTDAIDIALFGASDVDHNGVLDACECGVITTYCTAGTSTNGCTPQLSSIGTPTAGAASGFVLRATGVEGQKSGLIFYGLSGAQSSPWGASSSFLCVKAPTQRMTTTSSGGTNGACNGVLQIDFNAFLTANPAALGAPLAASQNVWAQGWYRDPPNVKTTQLTNAIEFAMCP